MRTVYLLNTTERDSHAVWSCDTKLKYFKTYIVLLPTF